MELSDVGEHVFAAECIVTSRMNKVNSVEVWQKDDGPNDGLARLAG